VGDLVAWYGGVAGMAVNVKQESRITVQEQT
jgi:hypothetical protein